MLLEVEITSCFCDGCGYSEKYHKHNRKLRYESIAKDGWRIYNTDNDSLTTPEYGNNGRLLCPHCVVEVKWGENPCKGINNDNSGI